MKIGKWMRAAGAAGAAIVMLSCNTATPDGAPPSVAKNAVDSPQDQRIFFSDQEFRYVIDLYDTGQYLLKTGDHSGLILSKREGLWSWKRSGTHQAILQLDEVVWNLTFVSPDDAMAVNPEGGGTKVFHFESM